MFPDRSVTEATVVAADSIVRGRGVRRALRRLERAEPELASYVMEGSSRIYARLDRACRSHARVRKIHEETMILVLVSIEAVRRST